jgi:hypothetical protein
MRARISRASWFVLASGGQCQVAQVGHCCERLDRGQWREVGEQ